MLAIALVLSSCSLTSDATPASTVCDGISAELGGCDELPVFSGETCDDVAVEFGAHLDEAAVGIIEGPAGVGGEARSSRLKQVMGLLAVLAERRLDAVGAECDPADFRATAEGEFSQELRDGVRTAMFDGEPVVTYAEWLADLDQSLRVLEPE